MEYDPTLDEPWREYRVTSPKWVTPDEWAWCLGHNLSWACTLRFAAAQGWWDGAGYHRAEIQRKAHVSALVGVFVGPPAPHGGAVAIENYQVAVAA